MTDENDTMLRAVDLAQRCYEQAVVDAIRSGEKNTVIALFAMEMVASVYRREARDLGVAKERLEELRKLASERGGAFYENSGLGKATRGEFTAAQHSRPDTSFTKEQWAAAGKSAADMISAIGKPGDDR